MTPEQVLSLINDDPFAQRLLASPIPARLAYIATDGTPRAIPIGYHFSGTTFVMATAEGAPKIEALRQNPAVALTIDTDTQPPVVLLVRGTVTVEMVDGVVPEYLEGARRSFQGEAFESFREQVTALYDRMAKITLTPTWAKVLDFETRAPEMVERLARAKGLGG
ncbi:pyridoxamine 5'-phosphate oxidase family protein [Pseudactinotalea sp.]|uniref:pyridoxamine 5'-phosphate oxidase family protein n=1 Tax=Pseudactinotalea sp. TaxID=1926260 RepID=UPI003B3BADFA